MKESKKPKKQPKSGRTSKNEQVGIHFRSVEELKKSNPGAPSIELDIMYRISRQLSKATSATLTTAANPKRKRVNVPDTGLIRTNR